MKALSLIDIMGKGMSVNLQNELLNLNDKSIYYGLSLSQKDTQVIVESRDLSLRDMGRIELGIDITKKIVEFVYKSPYTNREDYLENIVDIQESFYYLKNETLDLISDNDAVDLLAEMYDKFCGETKYIQSVVEDYARIFKGI